MTRALRRARRRRAVNKARRVMARIWEFSPEDVERLAPRFADNLRVCSCAMCRKDWQLRERREAVVARLDAEEVGAAAKQPRLPSSRAWLSRQPDQRRLQDLIQRSRNSGSPA